MAGNGVTFVDTNVLVYAHDLTEAAKRPVAVALLDALWESRTGAISTQVLQEFYAVATKKFVPPMTSRAAREIVALYGEWAVVHVDVPLIVAASKLEERQKLSFWDALIIEAAGRAGAARIVSENLQSGRRISRILIENPFA